MSADSPLASLAAVNRLKLQPGDVIAFKAGTIYETTASGSGALVVQASGTSNDPITFTSYGEGAAPIITNLASGYSDGIRLVGAKYITIEGLKITGGAQAGINIDKNSSFIRVENVEATGVGEGVLLAGNNSLVTKSYFHDLKMVKNTSAIYDDDYGAVGIMVSGNNNELSFNRIINASAASYDYGHDGGGIELFGNVSNLYIHDNWVENSVGFIEAGGNKGVLSNIVVTNNVSLNNGTFLVLHNGGGAFGSTFSNVDVSHNTIVNEANGANAMATIYLDSAYKAGQLDFHDNVVYLNAGDSVFKQTGDYHSSNTFYLKSSATHLYNNWTMKLNAGETFGTLKGSATGEALVAAIQDQSGRGASLVSVSQTGLSPKEAIVAPALPLTTVTDGITGKSYVSEHTIVSASGESTEILRYRADGSLESSKVVDADATTERAYDASGAILTQSVVKADGSRVLDVYNVQGQSFTTQHLTYDAAGVLTSLSQYHADGTKDYTSVLNGDGSTTASTYDAAGALSVRTVTSTSGSSETRYDMKGAVTQTVERDAGGVVTNLITYRADGFKDTARILNSDGSSTALDYDAAGVLSVKTVTAASASSEMTWYDKTGAVTHTSQKNASGVETSLITYHSDGTKDTARILNSDGSTTALKYDAAGILSVSNVTAASGSSEMTWYDKTGAATQAVQKDASGSQTSLITYQADGIKGSARILNDDGSTTSSQYDVAGKLKSATTVQKDGSSVANTYDATGAVILSSEKHADGSTDIYQFKIEGKGYSSSHLSYNASKQLEFAEMFNNDGTHTTNVSAANVTVVATAAKDTFFSYGGDTFVFGTGSGKDVIYNFHAGPSASHDTISLSKSVVSDFSHLAMRQAGSDVVIDLSAQDSITLKSVSLAALSHHDFLFV